MVFLIQYLFFLNQHQVKLVEVERLPTELQWHSHVQLEVPARNHFFVGSSDQNAIWAFNGQGEILIKKSFNDTGNKLSGFKVLGNGEVLVDLINALSKSRWIRFDAAIYRGDVAQSFAGGFDQPIHQIHGERIEPGPLRIAHDHDTASCFWAKCHESRRFVLATAVTYDPVALKGFDAEPDTVIDGFSIGELGFGPHAFKILMGQ